MKCQIFGFITVLLLYHSPLYAQDDRLTPSYSEDSQYIYDHPDVDINVNLFFNSWKNSKIETGHGGFAEQTFFTPGDPINPPAKGACLKYIKAYNHGFLYANMKTSPIKHQSEQVIFYVMNGWGKITSGNKTSEIKEGTGIFIPAGIEYSFANTSGVPLEVVILVEEIPSGFKPKENIVVRSYYDSPAGYCCWAYTTHYLFSPRDGLAEPLDMAVVTIENYGMGSPHFHNEGCEEIWLKIKGEQNLLLLGKKLLRQNIGEAWLTPQNGYVPHAVINNTETPMSWLYFANRHDKQK